MERASIRLPPLRIAVPAAPRAWAGGAAAADEALPFGIVFFVTGTARPGGGVARVAGRVIDPGVDAGHAHAKATGTLTTGSTRFILIGGCCNQSLGQADTYTLSGSTAQAADEMPYVQYNVCVKTSYTVAARAVPAGVTAFQQLPACPSGWTEVNRALGRYIVGLAPTGLPGATWGGKPLEAGEVRRHQHAMNGAINLPRHNIAGASGCCASGYAGSGAVSFTGNTVVDTASADDGAVQAPYYTATFCSKP